VVGVTGALQVTVDALGGVRLLNVARAVMVLSGLAMLSLAAWTYSRHDAPALRPFVLLVGVVGTLAVADGIAAGYANWLSVVWLAAYLFIPTAFGAFVVEYYGMGYLASWPRRAAYVATPVVALVGGTALIFEPSANGAMVGGGLVEGTAGSLPGWAIGASRVAEQAGLYFAGGTMLAGTGLLWRTVGTYEHLDRRLGAVLALVCIWPWLAYMSTPSLVFMELPVGIIIATTASGWVFSLGASVFAVTRGGLFDAAPSAGTLGPETVLANLEDAVVVVDLEERVVRLNDTAERTFGVAAEQVVGEPLSSVVDADLRALREAEDVELDVADGTRDFEASVSPVTDRRGRSPGYAVVLSDVTLQRVRAQRLAVLNRVLRHNLRNEMSRIVGRAEIIAEDVDEHRDTAESILETADELVELGDRAQQVEEMMSFASETDEQTDLSRVVESIVDPYRERHHDASISVDIDPSLSAAVDARVLERVVDNLVDNALVHNDATTPVVTVSARVDDTSDDLLRLWVSDNGPGLPEQEREVLLEGEETQLQHGSGLGLWAVAWGIRRMGGELDFAENQPRGTVVGMRLPRVDTSEPMDAAETVVGSEIA
jgi:PAS domain S-box-containing protein